MQFLDDVPEPGAALGERTYARCRIIGNDETLDFFSAFEGDHRRFAAQAPLQRSLQDAFDDRDHALWRIRDAKDQSPAPLFDFQIAQADESQLTTQMFGPSLDVGGIFAPAEFVCDAAAELCPERTGKFRGPLLPGVLAKAQQQVRRKVQPGRAFVVAQLASSQIVDDGSGGIETGNHKMLGKRNRSWQYRAVGRQPVKSSAFFPPGWRARCALGLAALALTGGATLARAQDPGSTTRMDRPLLLGGPVEQRKAKIPLDPRLPVGRLRLGEADPLLKNHLCSMKRPVCLESSSTKGLSRVTLDRLVRAFEEVVYGFDLPSAFASWEAPLRWQLDSDRRLNIEVRLRQTRGYDRGAARCVGGHETLETARRCVFGASLAARAPATASWLRDGWAAAAAHEVGPTPQSSSEIVTSFSRPGAGVLTSSRIAPARPDDPRVWVSPLRSARFFAYLSERAKQPASSVGFLSLSLAATRTDAGALRFEAEPDLADVVRATHRYNRGDVARFYDDFARWSYFDAREFASDMFVDWEIAGDTLPRTVAFSHPIEPSGSFYALLKLPPAMKKEVFGFRASCETPVSYVWSVTRLDGSGRELSTFPLTFQERNPDASGRVLPVPGMETLLVVGTNVGGVALTHPFDPDHEPHEAHGCRLSIDVVPADGGVRVHPEP